MNVIEPHIDDIWFFKAESIMTGEPLGTTEQLIEGVGRTCYKSEDAITDDSAPEFLRKLRKRGHRAMLEHDFAGMRIVADRGLTHELVRHRLASFAQESTRYCNYAKGKFGSQITVISQPSIKEGTREWESWVRTMQCIEEGYMELLDFGVPSQEARSILPIGLKSEIVITANLREWQHIFKMRCATAAHPIIRTIMREALGYFNELVPSMYEDQAKKFLEAA
jgi:thymidylate synthase (FAD)